MVATEATVMETLGATNGDGFGIMISLEFH